MRCRGWGEGEDCATKILPVQYKYRYYVLGRILVPSSEALVLSPQLDPSGSRFDKKEQVPTSLSFDGHEPTNFSGDEEFRS